MSVATRELLAARKDDPESIRAAYNSGIGIKRIAKQLCLSASSVRDRLHRLGVRLRPPGRTFLTNRAQEEDSFNANVLREHIRENTRRVLEQANVMRVRRWLMPVSYEALAAQVDEEMAQGHGISM